MLKEILKAMFSKKQSDMYVKLEYYPESGNNLYYVEFSKHKKTDPLRWALYKKNYITPFDVEGHPWKLMDGIVNENLNATDLNATDLNTKKFLHFMVNALNYYVESLKSKSLTESTSGI